MLKKSIQLKDRIKYNFLYGSQELFDFKKREKNPPVRADFYMLIKLYIYNAIFWHHNKLQQEHKTYGINKYMGIS